MEGLKPLFPESVTAVPPLVVAGPCSAETEEQVLETARRLAASGVRVFRAGVWKPRTKPGTFEGVGAPALPWLRRVREETGMLTAVEVGSPAHVREALAGGVDILWLGARTTVNPFAVQEIADFLGEYGKDVPVLVKNPTSPDLELWIGALERLYNAGLRRLGAVHRGFTSYCEHLYRNMPLWRIPIELRRRIPQLPVLCDPSHIGGKRELVAPLCRQALRMGFGGLMVESHCDPDRAWSDSGQQVTPEALASIVRSLDVGAPSVPTPDLALLRERIDELDDELLQVLEKRMEVSREIGIYKKEHGMPVIQMDRHDEIMQRRIALARAKGMDPEFMRSLLSAIHEESVRQQIDVIETKIQTQST